MKTFSQKGLCFIGDVHGDYFFIEDFCKHNRDYVVCQVGDLGLGFGTASSEQAQLNDINNVCKANNNVFCAIRGNHDSPKRFAEFRNKFSNVYLPEDCEVCEWRGKKIQFIGGALSIDRTARIDGRSYWKDEGVVFDRDKCQKVDILVTHTTPSYCFPQQFNEMVYGWARVDGSLLNDLTSERAVMDEIFKLCRPLYHVYGHFHTSWTEEINGCKHNLLDINEIREYRS
jgi:hypothetical protein